MRMLEETQEKAAFLLAAAIGSDEDDIVLIDWKLSGLECFGVDIGVVGGWKVRVLRRMERVYPVNTRVLRLDKASSRLSVVFR